MENQSLIAKNTSTSNFSLSEGQSVHKKLKLKPLKPKLKAAKTSKLNTKFSKVYGSINSPTTLPGLIASRTFDFRQNESVVQSIKISMYVNIQLNYSVGKLNSPLVQQFLNKILRLTYKTGSLFILDNRVSHQVRIA